MRERASESAPPPEPGVGGDAAEAAHFLRALATTLDERSLQVAVLHFLDGMTQDEVAQVLDISRKTVVRTVQSIRAKADALGAPQKGREHV